MDLPDKPCVICEKPFTPRCRTDKTCSLDHSVQWRRIRSRESTARRYEPRPPRPDTKCESCGCTIPVSKTGPMPRWCASCRATREDVRARKRVAVRRCHKCQKPVPDAARQPGKTVCDDCRVDPRKHRVETEQRRRLRKYGLTQEGYDKLLADQGGCCPGCGTDEPGAKGWNIDHSHKSGRTRALLCMRCNTVLGLVDEDPAVLRALADFAERMNEIKI